MNPETQLKIITHLEEALATSHGLKLTFPTVQEARLFRAKMYKVRKLDPFRYGLISAVEKGEELWLIRNHPEDPTDE